MLEHVTGWLPSLNKGQISGAYRVDIGGIECEAWAVAAWLVAWEGVGGGAVLAGDWRLVNECGVQTLNVSTICAKKTMSCTELLLA